MFYIGLVCSVLAAICFYGECHALYNGKLEEANKANNQWLLLLIAALICFK